MNSMNHIDQVGPVHILRANNGYWRWWCCDDNATSMGSILPSTSRSDVERLALGHLRRHHGDEYRSLSKQ